MQFIIIFLLLVSCVFANDVLQGTSQNPLLVETARDISLLRDIINSSSGKYHGVEIPQNAKGIYFKQTADIDLSEVCKAPDCYWEPISKFSGVYDGDGHVIDNLHVYADSAFAEREESAGLFAWLYNGEIRNVIIGENSTFDILDSNVLAGAVVGYVSSDYTNGLNVVENCENHATVNGSYTAGGLVGGVFSQSITLKNNVNHGKVSAYNAGGVAGYVSVGVKANIRDNINYAEVVGGEYAGGFASMATTYFMGNMEQYPEEDAAAVWTGLVNFGTVRTTASLEATAGGIIAKTRDISLADCYNQGDVRTNFYSTATGGIIGLNYFESWRGDTPVVARSVNVGRVDSSAVSGGIIGVTDGGKIVESLNIGYVRANGYAGGIVGRFENGYMNFEISNSMNAGMIVGANLTGNLAGYVGAPDGSRVVAKIDGNLAVGSMVSIYEPAHFDYSTIGKIGSGVQTLNSVVDTTFSYYTSEKKSDDTDKRTSTKDLVSGNLPEQLSSEFWSAKKGFYPVPVSLLNSPNKDIQKAVALAAIPVALADGNTGRNVDKKVRLATNDFAEDTVLYFVDHAHFVVRNDSLVPYNHGNDTLRVSNDVATRMIYLKNSLTGEWGSVNRPIPVFTENSLGELRDSINAGRGTFPVFDIESGSYAPVAYIDVSDGCEGKYFILEQDINLQSVFMSDNNWIPIGTEIHPFRGNFNGGNHRVSGLKQSPRNASMFESGLFGLVDGDRYSPRVIENLKLDSVSITCDRNVQTIFAAPLVSRVLGNVIVRNSFASGTIDIDQGVTLASSENVLKVAGLVREADAGSVLFENDTSLVDIKVRNANAVNVGGIVGYANDSKLNMRNSYNGGNLDIGTIFGSGNVGGLVAKVHDEDREFVIENSVNKGNVVLETSVDVAVGGLAGFANAPSVKFNGNANFGGISTQYEGTPLLEMGGLAGHIDAERFLVFRDDENFGKVSVASKKSGEEFEAQIYSGGFVGKANVDNASSPSSILYGYVSENNANHAGLSIVGDFGSAYVGGFVGALNSTFSKVLFKEFKNYGSLDINAFDHVDSAFVGGLYGYIKTTKNNALTLGGVNFGDIQFNVNSNTGFGYVGGIIGKNEDKTVSVEKALSVGPLHIQTNLDSMYVGGIAGQSIARLDVGNAGVYGNIDAELGNENAFAAVASAVGSSDAIIVLENMLIAGAVKVQAQNKNVYVAPFVGFLKGDYLYAKEVLSLATFNVPQASLGMTILGKDKPCDESCLVYFDKQLLLAEYPDAEYVSDSYNDFGIYLYSTSEILAGKNLFSTVTGAWDTSTEYYYPQLTFAKENIPEISATAAVPLSFSENEIASEIKSEKLALVEKNANGSLLNWSAAKASVEDYTIDFGMFTENATDVITASADDYTKIWYVGFVAQEKQTLDFSNASWSYDGPFAYDGSEHAVEIAGLPEGVSVTYLENMATKPGKYTAVAKFEYDEEVYYKPEFNTTLEWEILRDTLDISSIKWNYDSAFVYAATQYEVKLLNVPEEIVVDYVGNAALNVGVYEAYAFLNYDSSMYVLSNEFRDSVLTWEILGNGIESSEDDSTSVNPDSSETKPEIKDSTDIKDSSENALPVISHAEIKLLKNGTNLVLHNANAVAITNVKVFDALGHFVKVNCNFVGNDVVISGAPVNQMIYVRVQFATGGNRVFKTRL